MTRRIGGLAVVVVLAVTVGGCDWIAAPENPPADPNLEFTARIEPGADWDLRVSVRNVGTEQVRIIEHGCFLVAHLESFPHREPVWPGEPGLACSLLAFERTLEPGDTLLRRPLGPGQVARQALSGRTLYLRVRATWLDARSPDGWLRENVHVGWVRLP